MQSEELNKIFENFIEDERLYVAPEEVVRDVVQELKITSSDEEVAFIAAVLSEWSRIANSQYDAQRQHAELRINKSIQAMRNAFRLMLVMHNVTFYLGVALMVIGLISAFNGKAIAGITLGGIGFADLIFFLIKEPIEGLHESIGNLAQLRAAYNSYFVQLEQWSLYYDYQYEEEYIDVKRQIAEVIHQDTKATLDLIQKYCKLNSPDQQKRMEAD